MDVWYDSTLCFYKLGERVSAELRMRRGSLLCRVKVGVLNDQVGATTVAGGHAAPPPPPKHDEAAVRVLVGRRGFCIYREDGARVYASAAAVIEQILRAAAGEGGDTELREVSKQRLSDVRAVKIKLESGAMPEATSAQQLLVLIGRPVHRAVTMALTRRGRSASDEPGGLHLLP